jgi:hypothetical protein
VVTALVNVVTSRTRVTDTVDIMTVTESDVAWAAGFFEGEGSISPSTRRGRIEGMSVSLGSTDYDVIERFSKIWGCGSLCGPYQRGTHKPIWHFRIHNFDDAKTMLERMYPHLGQRRSARIDEVLNLVAKARALLEPRGDSEACHRGHKRVDHGYRSSRGYWVCRSCSTMHSKAQTERRRKERECRVALGPSQETSGCITSRA